MWKNKDRSQLWRRTVVIFPLRKLKQKDLILEVSLGYIAKLCLKTKRGECQKTPLQGVKVTPPSPLCSLADRQPTIIVPPQGGTANQLPLLQRLFSADWTPSLQHFLKVTKSQWREMGLREKVKYMLQFCCRLEAYVGHPDRNNPVGWV